MSPEFIGLTPEQARTYLTGAESQPSRALVASWVGDRTVLDVGCANGIDAGRYTAEQYVGVDISLALINEARRRHPQHTFQCLTTHGLALAGRRSAVVMVKSVLEHLPDEAAAVHLLATCRRLAQELLIVVWHTPPHDGATQRQRVRGHFGLETWQNTYNVAAFEPLARPRTVVAYGPHTIWRIPC